MFPHISNILFINTSDRARDVLFKLLNAAHRSPKNIIFHMNPQKEAKMCQIRGFGRPVSRDASTDQLIG